MESRETTPKRAADADEIEITNANKPPDFELLVRNYVKASPYITIPFAKHLISRAKPPVESPSVILDVGCGPGIVSGSINNPNTTIHAIDTAQGMVNTLNSYEWDNVIATVMDGEKLTYDDEIFTHVFSNFSIFTFADSKKGMRETVRVLREGGWFGGTSWNHLAWCGPAERAWNRLRPDGREVIEWPLPADWRTVKEVKIRMKEAGLKNVKVCYKTIWTELPHSRYITDILAPYMKMVMKPLGRLSKAEWEMFASYMAEELDKDVKHTKDGVKAKLVAVVATGRKRSESSSSCVRMLRNSLQRLFGIFTSRGRTSHRSPYGG